MRFQFSLTPVAERPGMLLAQLNGRLIDKSEALVLLNQLEEYSLDGWVHVVIEMSELDYINSSGLNILITLLTRCRNEGGEIFLCNISKKVKALFIMTKLNTVFTITEDVETAMNQMAELMNASSEQE